MPDWKQEIRLRLANLQLAPTREAAIAEELAQHLDESYAELLAGVVSEADAYRHVRAELHDGELLTHGLRRVERPTNPEPIVLGTNRRHRKSEHEGERVSRLDVCDHREISAVCFGRGVYFHGVWSVGNQPASIPVESICAGRIFA